MADKSYDDAAGMTNEPSVFDAKVAILLGPAEQKTILAERTVAGELVSGVLGNGIAQVSVSDTVEMLLEAVLALGETVCDQLGAPYSQAMPNFLAEFAATLIDTGYDGEDDARQAKVRAMHGLPPIGEAGGA